MAAFEMWDFLSQVSADSTMDIGDSTFPAGQQILPENGVKNQVVHLADDNSETVVSLSNDSIFHVDLIYPALTENESGELFNSWHSTGLANGVSRTFRYTHPTDGHAYTVRYSGDITRTIRVGNIYGVPSLQLRVLGRAT